MSDTQESNEQYVVFEPRWGFMENGAFVPLPREPFKQAGIDGPPPFDVKLPSGEIRHIILEPDT